MSASDKIPTTVAGHVFVGEVLPAAVYLQIIEGMAEALGTAFEVMAETFGFKFETAMKPDVELPDNYLCWFRIFDTLAYCRVMNFAIRSHIEVDPTYTITMSQNDVDAVNIAAQLLMNAADFMNTPITTQDVPDTVTLN